MKKFGMYVYCKRGGVSRDSGLHTIIEAETQEDAEISPVIGNELRWLFQFYDEVTYQIIEEKINE